MAESFKMDNIQLDHHHHKAASKKYPLCVLAHDLELPMNIGSLFRIADALGIEKIFLTGSSMVPPNAKIRKTSRATDQVVPFCYEKNPLKVIYDLKSKGYTVISLEMTSTSVAISQLSLGGVDKICLILGSENAGVSQELLNASDMTVHIPMLGQNSSMNVANACSIAAYEITQTLEKGINK